MSRGEHRLNFALIMNVILMLSLAGIFTIMNYRWTEYLRSMHEYIFANAPPTAEISGKAFVSYYLFFNGIVPLNLPVAVEFSILFYSGFISADAGMVHVNKELGKIDYAKINSLNLLQDAAEVEFMFCDKTGTLTKNLLSFRAF